MTESKELNRRAEARPMTEPEEYRTPAVDIFENNDSLVLLADMPGVGEDGVDVTVEQDSLLIIGNVKAPEETAGQTLYAEYRPLPFRRMFTVSEEIRRDGIVGKMRNGVLRLTLPKAEQARVRTIPVTAQ